LVLLIAISAVCTAACAL
jgi:hypothetical protein